MNRITRVDGWYDWPTGGRCTYDGKEYTFRTAQPGGWVPNEDDTDACYVPRVYSLHDETGRKVNAVFEDELYFNRDEYYGHYGPC
jgi:hypothetical protein